MGGLAVANGSNVEVGPGVGEFRGRSVNVGTKERVAVAAVVAVARTSVGAGVVASGASGVVIFPAARAVAVSSTGLA